jgi:hypothetical protein
VTGLNDDRPARLRDRALTDLLEDLEWALDFTRSYRLQPLLKRACEYVWHLRDQLREGK